MSQGRQALVTGFPERYLAVRVVDGLLSRDPDIRVTVIVPEEQVGAANEALMRMPAERTDRVRMLRGRTASMDMGLSGKDFLALAEEVRIIHHCGAIREAGASKVETKRENVRGAVEIVELAAAAPHLERVVHWSSTQVSGTRHGFVLEGELAAETQFHNDVERTLFEAERILHTLDDHVPLVVLRPAIVVGDSVTGEIDRLEGPYILLLLLLNAPGDIRLPMPLGGNVPLNLVPIDWVVEAGLHIAGHPDAAGRTFHLVEPTPIDAERAIELMAAACERKVPARVVPGPLANTILRTPGLARFTHVPRAAFDRLRTEVVYDDRNTRELLTGEHLPCPRFEDYVEIMVRYVRDRQAEGRARSVDARLADEEPLT